MDYRDEIRALIARVPALAGTAHLPQRLGGLINRVYRLGDLCLRLPGRGTEAYIDRKAEAVAAYAAAQAGISPEVVYADPDSGVMVTRFIDGTCTMTPAVFASHQMRRHGLVPPLPNCIDRVPFFPAGLNCSR